MTSTKPQSELLPPFGRETALLARGLTLGPPIRPGADPQALLLQAARSKDPETLYAIAGAAAIRGQMTRDTTEGYAWKILACERGYPCNGNFDWVTIGCPRAGGL